MAFFFNSLFGFVFNSPLPLIHPSIQPASTFPVSSILSSNVALQNKPLRWIHGFPFSMGRPWVAPSLLIQTRKIKTSDSLFFFSYPTNCSPHLHTLTKTITIKQAPYIHSPATTSTMPHTLPDHILTSLPPHSPSPNTHKHTWPTSFPARHESDGCSAFTGVIHGY